MKFISLLLTLLMLDLASAQARQDRLPRPTKRPQINKQDPAKGLDASRSQSKPSGQDEQNQSVKSDKMPQDPCVRELQKREVKFKTLAPITGDNGCGIKHPLYISQLSNGVKLSPAITVACQTALNLDQWVLQAATPFAQLLDKEPELTTISTASSYVCRNRNSQPDTKLSKHATGEAVDISAFHFSDGSKIIVSPKQRTGSKQEAYQKAVRFAACLNFTTVLGPYTDQFHAHHFHFDVASRRGGYRLCNFPDKLPKSE